jgi:hypothetical protein
VSLPDRSETSAASTSGDGLTPNLVRVHLRDVVELILKRLASSVLASTRDLANAGSIIQDLFEVRPRQLRDRCGGTTIFVLAVGALREACLELSRKVAVDGGQRL